MDERFFLKQISRLKEVYGEKHYPAERTAMIWREVQNFSASWFQSVIDDLIGSEQYPPLLPKIREKMSFEREKVAQRDRREHREDAKEFTSFFQKEDVHSVVETTCKKITGEMASLDFGSMVKSISKVTSSVNPYKCVQCFDTGVRDAFEGELRGAIVCECRSRKPILIKRVN